MMTSASCDEEARVGAAAVDCYYPMGSSSCSMLALEPRVIQGHSSDVGKKSGNALCSSVRSRDGGAAS